MAIERAVDRALRDRDVARHDDEDTREPDPPPLSATLTATPLQIVAGSSTTLSVTTQNLNAGESVSAYQWDWTNDGTIDETTIDPSRAHVYASDGIITPAVRLLTSTGRTSIATGRVIVSVAPPAPPAPPTPPTPAVIVAVTIPPQPVIANTPVTFTATATTVGDAGSIISYEWDWDTSDATAVELTTAGNSAAHTYTTAGSRTMRVTVRTSTGVAGSATFTVGVTN